MNTTERYARNQAIAAVVAENRLPLRDIAKSFGLTVNTVVRASREVGVTRGRTYVRRTRSGPADPVRTQRIIDAIHAGRTGQDVAIEFGVSRERIRQIVKKRTGAGLRGYKPNCECGAYVPRLGDWAAHRASAEHVDYRAAAVERRHQRAIARFWARVNLDGPIPEYAPDLGACWIWQAAHYPNGYGHSALRVPGASGYAHRAAYILMRGPIPAGLSIDHLCRVPDCVNPAHLEAVTARENILRSPTAPAALNARKTHCKYGHRFDAANTRLHLGENGQTTRSCRACGRARNQRQARKAA